MSQNNKKWEKCKNTFSNMGSGIRDLFTGNVLTKSFFKKHWGLFLWSFILVVIYMDNRMVCETSLKTIDHLRKTLVNEKYISMLTEAELLNNSRIGKIKELVEIQGMTLIEEKEPPYIIRIEK